MTVAILSFLIVLLIVAGMSIGVIMGRKPIKGSCGGIAALGMGNNCEVCGGNPQKCEEEQGRQDLPARQIEKAQFYDASDR